MPDPLSDADLEVMPDYSREDYGDIRNPLAAATLDNSQDRAIEALEGLWRKEIDRKEAIWAAQEAARIATKQAGLPNPPKTPKESLHQPKPNLPLSEKKKKPVILAAITNSRTDRPRPSAYAIRQLEAFEYVELWYFSAEGCLDAFSLQKLHKGSKGVVQDENLTWDQLAVAKGNFLYNIQYVANWPETVVAAFSAFYFNLDNHPIRAEPLGNESLIQYHAQVRRDWFDMFKRSASGDTFNISVIDSTLLLSINMRLIRAANHQERLW